MASIPNCTLRILTFAVRDLRGGYLIPGLIDTHIHFPQLRVLGGLGSDLLDWLEYVALPEEARMSDVAYACDMARRFVRALASHGTTTALVFGAHFKAATAALFRAAERSGLRIVSGRSSRIELCGRNCGNLLPMRIAIAPELIRDHMAADDCFSP